MLAKSRSSLSEAILASRTVFLTNQSSGGLDKYVTFTWPCIATVLRVNCQAGFSMAASRGCSRHTCASQMFPRRGGCRRVRRRCFRDVGRRCPRCTGISTSQRSRLLRPRSNVYSYIFSLLRAFGIRARRERGAEQHQCTRGRMNSCPSPRVLFHGITARPSN